MIYFFLLSFGILGAGIKYIDSAYDEKTFSKKIALCVAPVLGVLWAYTMLINPVAATILLAVICGVLFKGKIDNLAHFAGLGVIFAIIVIAGVQLLIIPLIFLAIAALTDEIGNDLVDKKKEKMNTNKKINKFIVSFFDQRWTLKVSILTLCILGIIPYMFFLAMLLFDYSYIGVRFYSQYKQNAKLLAESEKTVEIVAS
jgi:magnesium-transporting ATPase (P-type)